MLDGPNAWQNEISIPPQMIWLACKDCPPEGWKPTVRWHKSRVTALYKLQRSVAAGLSATFCGHVCLSVCRTILKAHIWHVCFCWPVAGDVLVQQNEVFWGKQKSCGEAKGSAELKLKRGLCHYGTRRQPCSAVCVISVAPNRFRLWPLEMKLCLRGTPQHRLHMSSNGGKLL